MARLNTFKIQFHSFENGRHEMDFDVNDSFFTFFEESEIQSGQVKVSVAMLKSERQLEFSIHLLGHVIVPCDRCLDDYPQDIDAQHSLYGKFGEGNTASELDVIWISNRESEVDLAPYIYEFIVLSLPIKKVHPENDQGESGCDPDMLDRLNDIVLLTDE